MKKLNLFLVLVVSIFLFNIDVKADIIEYDYGYSYLDNVNNFNELSIYLNENEERISRLYSLLFEKYNTEYINTYPYYLLQILDDSSSLYINLIALEMPIYLKTNGGSYGETYYEDGSLFTNTISNYVVLQSSYSFTDNTYILPIVDDYFSLPGHYGFQSGHFYEYFFLDSNFDLKIYTDMDNIIIHNYRDTNSNYIINSGDVYPTLYKNGLPSNNLYTEINLNNYAYVALSLKNYNQEPFSTNVQVKGNYCLTPVYNYGMTERKDILTGSQVQRCSPYYNNYTPVRTYITESDLKNNAIYYLKAYDTSKDNYVKVDTSVFDITYITEEEKDNPYVTIGNKTYPTIPYDNLTDTSTKSEDEGYNSGASCAVGDFNCMSSSSSSSFSDLFDKPLEILKTLWSSITNVFGLVTFLISLLPSEMATFLFLGFTLAIVIGLIKMIL